MTVDEWKEQISLAQEQHKREVDNINKSYALSNVVAGIFDIVRDHCKTIKVETISVSTGLNGVPCAVYRGPLVRKDGKEYKSGKHDAVWQQNIVEVNGVEVK